MLDTFLNINYWHWLALAFVLLALEITAPVTFFLWLCFAALAAALFSVVFPSAGLAIQLVMFSVFCIISLLAWNKFGFSGRETVTDKPHLNRRHERYLGRETKLIQAIENGVGRVTIEDSQWKVVGPDLAEGTLVRVVDVDGSLLLVERV